MGFIKSLYFFSKTSTIRTKLLPLGGADFMSTTTTIPIASTEFVHCWRRGEGYPYVYNIIFEPKTHRRRSLRHAFEHDVNVRAREEKQDNNNISYFHYFANNLIS